MRPACLQESAPRPCARTLTVLQVLPALEAGGVERGAVEVGQALVQDGCRSLVMSAGGRMVATLQAAGSEHFAWPIGRKSPLTLRLVPRLRRLLGEQRVDILHARSRLPAWIAWLAWRGMDPATRPHFVTTVHGLYSVSRYSAIMVRGERVIAVSDTVRRYVLEHYSGVDPGRIRVIYRGVDEHEFPYGYRPTESWQQAWYASYPQLRGRMVITLPGRLTRLKGHEEFITLMARLRAEGRPVHGVIVGGADARRERYARELERRVQQAGLGGAITFTGHRDDLREIFAVSDLVLSLSSQPESFGRTVLEALRLGVPVAGYGHGGVGEILSVLFPEGRVASGDLDALVERVRDFCDRRPVVSRSSAFRLQDMLRATLALYRELEPA